MMPRICSPVSAQRPVCPAITSALPFSHEYAASVRLVNSPNVMPGVHLSASAGTPAGNEKPGPCCRASAAVRPSGIFITCMIPLLNIRTRLSCCIDGHNGSRLIDYSSTRGSKLTSSKSGCMKTAKASLLTPAAAADGATALTA